jgi:hypothetical protein
MRRDQQTRPPPTVPKIAECGTPTIKVLNPLFVARRDGRERIEPDTKL